MQKSSRNSPLSQEIEYAKCERLAIQAEARVESRAREQRLEALKDHKKTYGIQSFLNAFPEFIPPDAHRSTSLVATFQGKYVHLQTVFHGDAPPKGKANNRGKITDFSRQSRRRLFDLFKQMDIRRKAVFLTLTYGEDYPNAKTAKNNLRAFLERIRRKFPDDGVSAVWRMEFQARGAIHFHLIFFNLPFIDKTEVQTMWGEVIGQERPFTRIEMIRSHRALMGYVSKYIAKVNDDAEARKGGFNDVTYLHALENPIGRVFDVSTRLPLLYLEAYKAVYGQDVGRMWGYFNKDLIPFAPRATFEIPLNYAKFFSFRDLAIKKYPKIADYRLFSFRLYVHNAEVWKDVFWRLMKHEIVTSGLRRVHPDLSIDFMHT